MAPPPHGRRSANGPRRSQPELPLGVCREDHTFRPRVIYDPDQGLPNWRFWVYAHGIEREVIQADLGCYLGPGSHYLKFRDTDGYDKWLIASGTGYNLTPAQLVDLQQDSARWLNEQRATGNDTRYRDTLIHRERNHYGPTQAPEPVSDAVSRPNQGVRGIYSTGHVAVDAIVPSRGPPVTQGGERARADSGYHQQPTSSSYGATGHSDAAPPATYAASGSPGSVGSATIGASSSAAGQQPQTSYNPGPTSAHGSHYQPSTTPNTYTMVPGSSAPYTTTTTPTVKEEVEEDDDEDSDDDNMSDGETTEDATTTAQPTYAAQAVAAQANYASQYAQPYQPSQPVQGSAAQQTGLASAAANPVQYAQSVNYFRSQPHLWTEVSYPDGRIFWRNTSNELWYIDIQGHAHKWTDR